MKTPAGFFVARMRVDSGHDGQERAKEKLVWQTHTRPGRPASSPSRAAGTGTVFKGGDGEWHEYLNAGLPERVICKKGQT